MTFLYGMLSSQLPVIQRVQIRKMTTLLLPKLFIISLVLHCCYSFTKVILHDAVEKGAVCLDGSPPLYYIRNGTTAPNKWIVYLFGGAWCFNEDECVLRTNTIFGSSNNWPPIATLGLSGLISDDCTVNPEFCGWSWIMVGYCDGASFSGNVDDPVVWNGTTLYFRGFRILNAIIDELLTLGGENMEDIIFTGCSAGGLATYLHADYFRSRIPSNISVHVLADGGYFIDTPNVTGQMHIRSLYQYVFKMQNCTGGVNQNCIRANPGEEWKCFMAQYTYPHIKTPIFVLNAQYDQWQLDNILQIQCHPPANCTEEQMMQLLNFGEEFLEAATPVIESQTNGVYISCQSHCHTVYTADWTQIMVGGQTAWDTFYYWLTNNTTFSTNKVNPTCNVTESPSGAGSNLRLVRHIHIGQAVGIISFWLLIILY